MTYPNNSSCIILLAILILFGMARPTSAQEEVGALYGTVTDTEGEALPGVSLSLTGLGSAKQQLSDALGKFRFLGLDPGPWSLEAHLDGFSSLSYPNIEIRVARNTTIEIRLPAAIEEVISVTAESPLLDERKLASGTRVSRVELEKIPTARDPWAILNQAPGVVVRDVNVGGSSSDYQSTFRGVASTLQENDYILDGTQITSAGTFALGTTSGYYDFDQFQEIQITTGGNDITKNTAGVAINMVTKRGTNEFRGSARFLLTDNDGYFGVLQQAEPGFDNNDLGAGQEGFVPNQIDRIEEIGFEAGGPAWRNRIWLWGSWAEKDITLIAGSGEKERTVLEQSAIKVNTQFSAANSFVGSYSLRDKRARGRGAAPSVDPSATWNQDGPGAFTKIEDSHVFGSSLFLSGQYFSADAGFSLAALGGCGPEQPANPFPGGETNTDINGYLTNTVCFHRSDPQKELKADGAYFFTTSSLGHEIKFGGRIREFTQTDQWTYPGRNLWHYHGALVGVQDPELLQVFGLPPERYLEAHVVYAYRQGPAPLVADYQSVWLQNTVTRGPWTLNAGLRYDRQEGDNRAGSVAANPAFPEIMPALVFGGNDADGIRWTSLSPRLGLTYALGAERKTLLRGSLSQYPRPLGLDQINRVNPINGQWAWIIFLDEPGGYPAFYDDGETYVVGGGFFGFDPDNPTALSTANKTDSAMDPELTRELILGAEHSFLPELVAGLNLTWRKRTHIQENQDLYRSKSTDEVTPVPASEYVLDRVITGLLPDGSPYEVQTWAADPSDWTYTGGDLLTEGDREVDYLGASLTLTKRLANQWMLRGFVNYNFDESWSVPTSYFDKNDPNRLIQGSIDNQIFAPNGTLQSTWQWNLNGMYQLAPERAWGFNVAANFSGRQGEPIGYRRRVPGTDGNTREILVEDHLGDFRSDDISIVDVRLEKEFAATGTTSLTFSVDGFNIFNSGAVLGRYTNLGAGNGGWVAETVSPRIWRLGVRLNWR